MQLVLILAVTPGASRSLVAVDSNEALSEFIGILGHVSVEGQHRKAAGAVANDLSNC